MFTPALALLFLVKLFLKTNLNAFIIKIFLLRIFELLSKTTKCITLNTHVFKNMENLQTII